MATKVQTPLDLGSNKITSLATPTASTDAATKSYADGRQPYLLASDYGVVADNSTDNATALQSALDAAKNTSYIGGKTVLLPPGISRLASGVNIASGVELLGSGAPGGSTLRASGDSYFMVTATQALGGTRAASVRNVGFDAVTKQTSGGGFNGTSNWGTLNLQDLQFGNNLYTCIQAKPAAAGAGGGRYYMRNIRVLEIDAAGYPTGITKAFVLDGSSANSQMVEFYLTNFDCSVAANEATDWLTLLWCDTVQAQNCLFFQGNKGLVAIGADSSHRVTSCRFSSVVFDSQTVYAISEDYTRPIDFTDCQVVNCSAASTPAITVGANSQGFTWTGGMIAKNSYSGVLIKNGATHTTIHGAKAIDNNTGNTASIPAIDVEANTTDFTITDNTFANPYYSGHQKSAVRIASGTSDRYNIVNNRVTKDSDLTIDVSDAGTGKTKHVWGNSILGQVQVLPSPTNVVSPIAAQGSLLANNTVTSTADQAYFGRCIIPVSGNLRDVYVYIGATGGNMKGLIYDDGTASAGNRTRLWLGGATSVAATGWLNLGDPALAVLAGQHIELGFVTSSTTASQITRYLNAATNGGTQLPSTSFMPAPGGASPKLVTTFASSYASPASSYSEATFAANANCPQIIARIG